MGAIKLSAEQVIAQLNASMGNISHAAGRLGTSRTTLHAYINEHPTVRLALGDIRESTLDKAELLLQKRMESSDTLLIFFLKTQGRKRGYSENYEISGPGGGPIISASTTLAEWNAQQDKARKQAQAALDAFDEDDA